MLSRQNRYSFKSGVPQKSISAPFFVLRFQKNDAEGFRCAFVVSKKVSKKAVERNRLKRQFSMIVEKISKEEHLNISAVFYINKRALTADPSEIEREIVQALERIDT